MKYIDKWHTNKKKSEIKQKKEEKEQAAAEWREKMGDNTSMTKHQINNKRMSY